MATTTTTPVLDFVMLYVSNIEASLAYFTEKLGFTYIAEESSPTFSQLKSTGGGIDFALFLATPETPTPGHVELYFKTDDLESLREAWTAKGLEATPIYHRPFGSIFSVTSPDGQGLTMLKN
jgi:catechol 2,3-dioxygenase-like lactoylglutathione lyase family enzyme